MSKSLRAAGGWRRWLAVALSALVVVAVIVAHSLPRGQSSASRQIPASLALDPTAYTVSCLEDAAWSPDGREIAILGAQPACSFAFPEQYAYFPTVMTVVDATTGKLMRQFQPDGYNQQKLGLGAPQYITPAPVYEQADNSKQAIQYEGLAWSPDGKRLALPFYIGLPTSPAGPNQTFKRIYGVYLAAPDGTGQQALSHVTSGAASSGLDYSGEWNVKTGAYMPPKPGAPPTSPTSFTAAPLQPLATTYTWNSDGSLTGANPLSADGAPGPADAPAPVGDPIGGRSFSLWQPTEVSTLNSFNNVAVTPPATVAAFQFVAWSPDGTYLLQAFTNAVRLQPTGLPVPGPQQLAQLGLTSSLVAPLHDRTLDTLLNHASASAGQGRGPGGDFAWSPDGKLLATYSGDHYSDGANAGQALVYDAATGQVKQTFTIQETSNAEASYTTSPLHRSPDGTRLLAQSHGELFALHVTAKA